MIYDMIIYSTIIYHNSKHYQLKQLFLQKTRFKTKMVNIGILNPNSCKDLKQKVRLIIKYELCTNIKCAKFKI